jgi:hypothetical protein
LRWIRVRRSCWIWPFGRHARTIRRCRYADDWLLGFTGPRREAEQVKAEIGQFPHDQLKLELSPTKTLITHGRTKPARYLGYEITVLHADHKHDHRGHRGINAAIGRMPGYRTIALARSGSGVGAA